MARNLGNEFTGKLPNHPDLKIIQVEDNWVQGTYKRYTFDAKVFPVGSQYGIAEGRVSKLSVRLQNKEIFNYDRGMDIDHKVGHEIAALFKEPTKREPSPALDKVSKKVGKLKPLTGTPYRSELLKVRSALETGKRFAKECFDVQGELQCVEAIKIVDQLRKRGGAK